ncbi:hypothetical protein ACG2F4_10125 [Halalkalibaculum sp. DA3122]|uniref:hypothetical protein n=1 Tax=unclassified Halalkalibaculum TaxID=2964617 RepID=UPI003754F3E0
MASLKKRGKFYYIRFTKVVNGKQIESTKSLGTRYKEQAQEALRQMEEGDNTSEAQAYGRTFIQ